MDSDLRNSKNYLSAFISTGKTTLLELKCCTKHKVQNRRHPSSKSLITCHSYQFQCRHPNFVFVRKENTSKFRALVFEANCSKYSPWSNSYFPNRFLLNKTNTWTDT